MTTPRPIHATRILTYGRVSANGAWTIWCRSGWIWCISMMPNSSGSSKSARRGYLRTRVALLLLGGLISATAAEATAAEIEITPITHASVQLAYDGKVIQVDPVQDAQKADL